MLAVADVIERTGQRAAARKGARERDVERALERVLAPSWEREAAERMRARAQRPRAGKRLVYIDGPDGLPIGFRYEDPDAAA